MERLTTKEKYPHGAEGKSKNNLTGKYCRGVFEATAVVEKLSYYENLEESLEKVYGECDGLLEASVKHLIEHVNSDIWMAKAVFTDQRKENKYGN